VVVKAPDAAALIAGRILKQALVPEFAQIREPLSVAKAASTRWNQVE
jgi:hypothetical protein